MHPKGGSLSEGARFDADFPSNDYLRTARSVKETTFNANVAVVEETIRDISSPVEDSGIHRDIPIQQLI